jgi:penicillin-binding protein 1A
MVERTVPDGIITVNGDYYYAESPPGLGVRNLDAGDAATQSNAPTKDEVKNELF